MNRFKSLEGEAVLDFGDGDFVMLKPGAYVVCAVTGEQIPLEELRYWNARLNEAYKDAQAAVARWRQLAEEGNAP